MFCVSDSVILDKKMVGEVPRILMLLLSESQTDVADEFFSSVQQAIDTVSMWLTSQAEKNFEVCATVCLVII